MRTFAQRPKATPPTTSAESTIRRRGPLGPGPEVRSIPHSQRTASNQTVSEELRAEDQEAEAELTGPTSPRSEHDFSRIPIHPPAAGAIESTGPIAAPPLVHEVLRSPGQPLDPATRAFMEQRFDHDFSHVSLHTGPKAAESARAIHAAAYTVGDHIVFGHANSAGEGPGASPTLAHELAHVVQQRRGGPSSPRAGSGALEEAADTAAATLTTGAGPVHVSGASAPGLARQPAAGGPGPAVAETEDRVAAARVENEDGTWSSVNSEGMVLDTGPLGPVIDPTLPELYATVVGGEQDEAARKAALRQWADPAWTDPLSPVGDPGSYDPEIYDPDVLARKAAERKFDEYDRKEYGANGVIYKKRGSGRVYANDIAAEDYKELTERYGIKVSTDPDRVVLPTGSYAYESVYEGKLLRKIMEDNKLPREAIHQVAMQLEAEIEGGAYLSVAGIGTTRYSVQPRPPAPPPVRKAPGPLGRAYLKLRLKVGLAGRGVDLAGANPTIGAGGGAGRPVVTLQQPAVTAPRITAPTPTSPAITPKPPTVAAPRITAPAPTAPVTTPKPPVVAAPKVTVLAPRAPVTTPRPTAVVTVTPPIVANPVQVAPRAPVAPPAAPVVTRDAPMRRPPGGGERAGMTATAGTLTPHKASTPVKEVLPRSTVPMKDFEPPEPGHYIRRKPPSADTQRRILEQAGRTRDGRLRDANTGRALNDGEAVWGHAPNYQFKEMRDMAEKLGWTQDEFDAFFEDPNKWQVEYGPSNSGRVFDRIPRQRPVH